MQKSSTNLFKDKLDSAFSKAGKAVSDIDVISSIGQLKRGMSEVEDQELKGGKADNLSFKTIAKKHKVDLIELAKQFIKGFNVELEHTSDHKGASEIVMDHLTEDPKYYDKLSKVENKEQKLTAKQQFAVDLKDDPDFEKHKKNSKFYERPNLERTYGTVNVTKDDPYIKKKTKYGRPGKGKEESNETTGASSAGSYVAPFAFDSKFMQKSDAETPKKEIDEVQYGDYQMSPVKVATNSDGQVFRIGDRAIAFDRMKPIRIISLQQKSNGKTMAYHKEGDFMSEINIDGLIPLGKRTVSKVEANEVTGAASAGQYSGPAMWAKSTSKKDWRGASKPLYKGGKFVQVKGKCKKFPYCNQGDIKSLKIWENETLKRAIKSTSRSTGLSENTLKGILQYELEKNTKK